MDQLVQEKSEVTAEAAWPEPHPELRRLEPLLGRWTQRGQTRDGVLGPGVPYTSEEQFYWLEGGHFLVQTYNSKFGTEPAQKGINYWYFDSDTKNFQIIFFSNNGPFTEEGNRYRGVIEKDRLTFTGPARFTHRLDDSGRIAVSADGSIESQWSLRDENGEFRPWMDARLNPAD